MGTSYESAQVRCPFYRYNDDRRISCEGTEDGSFLYLYFDQKGRRKKQMTKYCEEDYENCKIYQAVMKKYHKK